VLDEHFISADIEVQLVRVFEVKEGGWRLKVKYKNNTLCDSHRRPPLEASFGASMVILNLTVGYDPSFIKREMFWKYVPHTTFCRYAHFEAIGSVSSHNHRPSTFYLVLWSFCRGNWVWSLNLAVVRCLWLLLISPLIGHGRVIISRKMRWGGHVAHMGGWMQNFIGKPEGKRPLWRCRNTSEDDIEMRV
jgi:hypothetical protein